MLLAIIFAVAMVYVQNPILHWMLFALASYCVLSSWLAVKRLAKANS